MRYFIHICHCATSKQLPIDGTMGDTKVNWSLWPFYQMVTKIIHIKVGHNKIKSWYDNSF